jgi:peptide deformylase
VALGSDTAVRLRGGHLAHFSVPMIRPIVIWPDSRLEQVSEVVREDWQATDEFKRLVADMYETMYAKGGIGLAAIQVGVPARLFVADVSGRGREPQCFINPTITEFIDEPQLVDEGCLSLPGVRERALRHLEVIVTYRDLTMVQRNAQLYGLEAQVAQHEIDHLDGKLFVQALGFAKRDLLKRKIAKTLKLQKRTKR